MSARHLESVTKTNWLPHCPEPGAMQQEAEHWSGIFRDDDQKAEGAAAHLIATVVLWSVLALQDRRHNDYLSAFVRKRLGAGYEAFDFSAKGVMGLPAVFKALLSTSPSAAAKASMMAGAARGCIGQKLRPDAIPDAIRKAGGYVACYKNHQATKKDRKLTALLGANKWNLLTRPTKDEPLDNDLGTESLSTRTPEEMYSEGKALPIEPLRYMPVGANWSPEAADLKIAAAGDAFLNRPDGDSRRRLFPICNGETNLALVRAQAEVVDALPKSLAACIALLGSLSARLVGTANNLRLEFQTREAQTDLVISNATTANGRAKEIRLSVDGLLDGLDSNEAYGIFAKQCETAVLATEGEDWRFWQVAKRVAKAAGLSVGVPILRDMRHPESVIDIRPQRFSGAAAAPVDAEWEIAIRDWLRLLKELGCTEKKAPSAVRFEFDGVHLSAFGEGATEPVSMIPAPLIAGRGSPISLGPDFHRVLRLRQASLGYGAYRLSLGIGKDEFVARIGLIGAQVEVVWQRIGANRARRA